MRGKTEVEVLEAGESVPVEAAEREWGEELQTLIEDIPISICSVDIEGNITYVNKGFEEIFGYSREEVLGKNGVELGIFSDQDLRRLAERMEARLKGEPSRRLETQLKCKDGKWIWVETEATVIKKSGMSVGFRLVSKDITERRQVEKTVESPEERLKILFEFAPDAYYLSDMKGSFVDGNKAAEELTGYKREELIGKNFLKLKLLPPKQIPKAAMLLAKNALGKATGPDEFTLNRKDGNQVLVEIRTIPVKIGDQTSVLGIARDVTERKRAEESLKESEERYRGLFENSTEGVFAVDLAGNYTSVNKAMEELTGYSREELIGRSYRDFVSPETAEFIFGEYNKLFRTGEPVHNIVYERISKDGKRGWSEGYASVIKKEGMVVGFQGTLRDITERKRVEEALRKKTDEQDVLLSSIPAYVYFKDTESKLITANKAFAEMVNTPIDQLPGKDAYDLFPKEQAEKFHIDDKKVMASGKPMMNIEEQFTDADGKTRWASTSKVPYFNEKGKVGGMVAITIDITERKQAEEEIHKLTQYLESVIDNANVLLSVLDREGNVLVWNKAAQVISGYSREEVVGHNNVWGWLYPDKEHRRAIAAKLAAVMEGEIVEHFEWTIRTKRGEDRTLSWYSRNLLDEKGNPIGAVWLGTDITERKRLEQSLKESEERYRMLFENSIEAAFTVDIAGSVTSGNKALEELTGCPLEEILGASYKEFVVPEDVDHVFEEYNKLFRTGEPIHNLAYQMVRKDGERRLIEGYVNLISEGTRMVGFQGTLRDITQRKKAEEQLEHSFIDLAETVSRAIGSRDPYTAVHQRRVAELARLVGEKIGLDKHRLQGLYIGGLLHDIGKISAPETILTKSGKLTDEEWSLIRVHTKRGHEILQGTNLPWPVAEMALHHHERLDGSGYPCRISGDELSLEIRILGVCDVVEAMSSHRPYRPARSSAEVWEELVSGRGTKYDASIVDIMFQIIESGELGALLSPPE